MIYHKICLYIVLAIVVCSQLKAQQFNIGYNIGYASQSKFNLNGIRHTVFLEHGFSKIVSISVGLSIGSGKGIDISESLNENYLIYESNFDNILKVKRISQGISNHKAWNAMLRIKLFQKNDFGFNILCGFNKINTEAILRPLEEIITLNDNSQEKKEFIYPIPLYHNYSAWNICSGFNISYKFNEDFWLVFKSTIEHDFFTHTGSNIELGIGCNYNFSN